MQLIPNIGLAKFKLHPTRKAQENPITCILSHNEAAFYTVTPSRMVELLEAEEIAKDRLKTLQMIHEGKLDASDLINLYEVSK